MFSPLAVDVDERVPAIASSDLQIARDELRGFGDARAGIVEEEEEGVFDPVADLRGAAAVSSRWSRNCRIRRAVKSCTVSRSTGLRVLAPTNGSRRANVSQ